jgi:hypothetical protein
MDLGFRRLRLRLSDLLKLQSPDSASSLYGRAFERAVLILIKVKDVAAAMRAFIERYGEPHAGAFAKLAKLASWARRIARAKRAPPVPLGLPAATLMVQADFLVDYADGRREIVELKSHVLRESEWRVKAEWSLAAKVMRMAYRRAGIDRPVRLLYFAERGGDVALEEEVYLSPRDCKDDEMLIRVLGERIREVAGGT